MMWYDENGCYVNDEEQDEAPNWRQDDSMVQDRARRARRDAFDDLVADFCEDYYFF